jgi:hypothetical protein
MANLTTQTGLLYAELGLWYDAFITAWTLPNQSERQGLTKSLIRDLATTETDPIIAKSLNQLSEVD